MKSLEELILLSTVKLRFNARVLTLLGKNIDEKEIAIAIASTKMYKEDALVRERTDNVLKNLANKKTESVRSLRERYDAANAKNAEPRYRHS